MIRKKAPLKISWKKLLPFALCVLFFSFSITITYDSAHYLGYVSIFEGETPASEWDAVRGPIFPIIIHLFGILFGKSNTGILVGSFILYLIFCYFTFKLCQQLTATYKNKTKIQTILFIILTLNPLIFGYFHVLLTEYIAITLTIVNIFISYKWISSNYLNKKQVLVYTSFFIISTLLCYHLKQPYLTISFTPLIVASIIAFISKRNLRNAIYRFGTIILSTVILILSIISWDMILDKIGADQNNGRDSSSMLGEQLLKAYQIKVDGIEQPISTMKALSVLTGEFTKDPFRITGLYFLNYCGTISICTITSPNGIDYTPIQSFNILDTYENQIIGYSPYRLGPNTFPLSEKLEIYAKNYSLSSIHKSIFSLPMQILQYPTNILFKISLIFCPLSIVVLFIFKRKDKKSKYINIFRLSIILLITSLAHIIISAGVGLIIDRYAIEAFVPAVLGIFGTVTYVYLIKQQIPASHKKGKLQHKKQRGSS